MIYSGLNYRKGFKNRFILLYRVSKKTLWKFNRLLCITNLKDIGTQNFYYLYLLGILAEYLISYFGRFVAFSC